jgi:dihydrofolate reductase
MRHIFLFMNVSLDGYFEEPGHDISGFTSDPEAMSSGSDREVDTILLGHRTYEMMKFWSTPQAMETMPDVSRFFNQNLKVVASHQPFDPGWSNVRVITGNVAGEVRKLKEQPGKNIIMFGSNTLCVTLMQAGLIDEFQIVVNPVVFGKGTSLFAGLLQKEPLTLTGTRTFKSGGVLLTYTPVRS